jgi:hypothetical protein
VVNDIAKRFFSAVDDHLGFTPAELSRRLGYSNPSTIQAIKKRTALPDFARLSVHKGALRDGKGRMLNLHWVITGDGAPLLKSGAKIAAKTDLDIEDDIVIKLKKLSSNKRTLLLKFLAEFP